MRAKKYIMCACNIMRMPITLTICACMGFCPKTIQCRPNKLCVLFAHLFYTILPDIFYAVFHRFFHRFFTDCFPRFFSPIFSPIFFTNFFHRFFTDFHRFFDRFFHQLSPIFSPIFFTDFSIQFLMWKNPQPKNIITNFIINVIMDGASST